MSEFHVLGEDGNRKIDLSASFDCTSSQKEVVHLF